VLPRPAKAPTQAGLLSCREPIRVVLADDHDAVRGRPRLLLDGEAEVEAIADATDLPGVMRHVHGHGRRVLVLDLQLPNGSAIETIRQVRDQAPDTEVVVLTMEDSPLFAQRATEAGAVGFVLSDAVDTELLTAVRRAARGEEYVSERVAKRLDAVRRAVDGDGLSRRETEVLRLIALGHTTREIAAQLYLSRRTVETHRARIHRKLGLTSRAELVQFALRRGLIGA
jgi:two-component system, NarL family, response regulator NreC